MQVLLQVPDDIAERLGGGPEDLSREALESWAAEGCRNGRLSAAEVQRMLGFETRLQTDAFLKERGCYLDYSEEDYRRDLETLSRLSGR